MTDAKIDRPLTPTLDRVRYPADLKGMSDAELKRVADELGELVEGINRDREDRSDRAAEAKLPKTITDKFGEATLDQLLKVCHVMLETDLPPAHGELAGRPKALSERLVIQREVDRLAAKLKTLPF